MPTDVGPTNVAVKPRGGKAAKQCDKAVNELKANVLHVRTQTLC